MSKADKTLTGKNEEEDDSETETEGTEEDEQTESSGQEEEDTEDDGEEDPRKATNPDQLPDSKTTPTNKEVKLQKPQTTEEQPNRDMRAEGASAQGGTISSGSQNSMLQTSELKEYFEKTVNELINPVSQAIGDMMLWKQEISVELENESNKLEQIITKVNELQAEIKLVNFEKFSNLPQQQEQMSQILPCLQKTQNEHSTTLSQLVTFKQESEERWKMMLDVERNTAFPVAASTSNLQVKREDPVGRSTASPETRSESSSNESTNLLKGLDENSLQLLHTEMLKAQQLNYTDLLKQIRS